jgi:Lrp/AsnC family leucine-responsive transcriptional regulator
MTKIALDKTDRKILSILQTDGRLSNQDVAEQVNLSPSPCLRRIKRLEEEGVIRQYVALLDPDKIGLGLLAYVNVRLEKHSDAAAHSNARAVASVEMLVGLMYLAAVVARLIGFTLQPDKP